MKLAGYILNSSECVTTGQVAYQEGDVVYKPGDTARYMYFVVSGRVTFRPTRLATKQLRKIAGLRMADSDEASPTTGRASTDSDYNGGAGKAGDPGRSDEKTKLLEDMGVWSVQDGEIFGEHILTF